MCHYSYYCQIQLDSYINYVPVGTTHCILKCYKYQIKNAYTYFTTGSLQRTIQMFIFWRDIAD